ncbi:hypothetical protein HanXRQr2_Chr01g0004281 [Helianthus annuus]|uniref:Uncharacterized protein n=1 Tax=Helianthus annuus TaxID=4232 RepID=A0A9K3JSV1_HELAN|nr:hypothetical protein HanXRQr2_Chr01g0004281 [Helianthus annuus]
MWFIKNPCAIRSNKIRHMRGIIRRVIRCGMTVHRGHRLIKGWLPTRPGGAVPTSEVCWAR